MKQQKMTSSKWIRGVKEPFQGGKQKLASIPKNERQHYIAKIMQISQLQETPPYSFQEPFQHQSFFEYKNYRMNYYYKQNRAEPKAIIICIHGLNSYGQFFGYIADTICTNLKEVNLYAFDQLNFGKSDGPFRGEIISLEDSLSQAKTFINFIKSKFSNNPKIFLVGHSYGGAIAFKMSILNPEAYSGIILLTPALRDLHQYNYCIKKVAKIIGFFLPRMRLGRMPSGSGTKYNLSQKFKNDEFIYTDAIVPGTIRALLIAFQQISGLYNQFRSPFLGIGAGMQKITDVFALLDLEQQCLSQDKQIIICQDMWHVVNQQQQLQALSWVMAEWLRERI